MTNKANFTPTERRRWARAATPIAFLTSALALAVPTAAQQSQAAVLRVAVNHAAVLRLEAAPAVALVADPLVADIINERNNLMFVLGRKPGATNLLAFDAAGHRLLDREIVVVPETADTVTITRATDATDYTCAPRCAFRAHTGTPGGSPSEIGAASQGTAGAASAGSGVPAALGGSLSDQPGQ